MKWMWSTAIVFVSVSAIAGAQSADMNKTSKSDTMKMTYTGCIEAVNHGGTFLLTHVGDAANVFALTGSSQLKKHVGHKVAVTGTVSHGAMGTMRDDLSTLTVTSLKVVAKSCS